MNFFRISFWAGISTVCAVLTGIVSTKFIAAKIGPPGVALLGQFYNITNILSLIGGLGIGNGIINYLAKPLAPAQKEQFIAQVLKLILPASVGFGICIIAASSFIARYFLGSTQYSYSFVLLGAIFSLLIFNSLAANILLGIFQSARVALISIINSILSVAITILFFYFFEIRGILAVISVLALITCGINYYALKRSALLPSLLALRQTTVERSTLQFLSSFTIMSLASSLLIPLLQLAIRSTLIRQIDTTTAGYWQAVNRFSDYNVLLFATVLNYYYLPKVSSLETRQQIGQELKKTAALLLPVVLVSCTALWVLRHFLIRTFLSESFLPSAPFMGFQVIGDFFHISSLLMGLLFWARKKPGPFIASEVLFVVSNATLFFFLFPVYGVYAAVYAYTINYILYFSFCLVYFRKYVFAV